MTPGPAASDYRGARALVTGATGFVGRWVARSLTEAGARLFVTARDRAAAAPLFRRYGIEAEVLEADLLDAGDVARVVEASVPDVTFNLAGYGVDRSERDEDRMYGLDAVLVDRLCRLVARRPPVPGWGGQRLVHAGSALEYGRAPGDLDEEDTLPLPGTAYGRAKLAGTRALRAHRCCDGLRAVCARLFTLYGPGEHPGRLLPSLLEAAREDRPLELTEGGQERDFTYVEDIAAVLLRLGRARDRLDPVVNVATGALTSVRAFALAAARVLGIPEGHVRFGALPTRPEEMDHDPVAVGRLRRILGEVPTTGPEEGVARTRDRLAELARRG